jgi:hypothetical protein
MAKLRINLDGAAFKSSTSTFAGRWWILFNYNRPQVCQLLQRCITGFKLVSYMANILGAHVFTNLANIALGKRYSRLCIRVFKAKIHLGTFIQEIDSLIDVWQHEVRGLLLDVGCN